MQKPHDIFIKSEIMKISGSWPGNLKHICIDSREVQQGDAFIAINGTVTDGHQYISKAVAQGAALIIYEQDVTIPENICGIQVKNSAIGAGELASAFYGHPSKAIKVVGITGTNGKTTIATLLHNLFSNLGYKCGLLSTINIIIGEEVLPSTHTTPDAVSIQKMLARMEEENCEYCFMEVSSHAVDQHRIAGLQFAGGLFTNLTHDHLDYHKTFKAYLEAKKAFFDQLPKTAFALTNTDDKNGKIMTQNTVAEVKTYGLKGMADFKTRLLENSFTGLYLNLDNEEFWSRLCGSFNAYNLTAVYATAVLLNQNKQEVLIALSKASTVEGRFDIINGDNGVTAVIDYAHTPDALKNVLSTINDIREGKGQLITVAGAGGDRDTSKRAEMASIASRLSTKLILTSDNPRSEDPDVIIDMMMEGVEITDKRNVLRITNRREAIRTACTIAAPGDIVLVAGKGHEKYQEINGVKYPFDDKAIVVEILKTEN